MVLRVTGVHFRNVGLHLLRSLSGGRELETECGIPLELVGESRSADYGKVNYNVPIVGDKLLV